MAQDTKTDGGRPYNLAEDIWGDIKSFGSAIGHNFATQPVETTVGLVAGGAAIWGGLSALSWASATAGTVASTALGIPATLAAYGLYKLENWATQHKPDGNAVLDGAANFLKWAHPAHRVVNGVTDAWNRAFHSQESGSGISKQDRELAERIAARLPTKEEFTKGLFDPVRDPNGILAGVVENPKVDDAFVAATKKLNLNQVSFLLSDDKTRVALNSAQKEHIEHAMDMVHGPRGAEILSRLRQEPKFKQDKELSEFLNKGDFGKLSAADLGNLSYRALAKLDSAITEAAQQPKAPSEQIPANRDRLQKTGLTGNADEDRNRSMGIRAAFIDGDGSAMSGSDKGLTADAQSKSGTKLAIKSTSSVVPAGPVAV